MHAINNVHLFDHELAACLNSYSPQRSTQSHRNYICDVVKGHCDIFKWTVDYHVMLWNDACYTVFHQFYPVAWRISNEQACFMIWQLRRNITIVQNIAKMANFAPKYLDEIFSSVKKDASGVSVAELLRIVVKVLLKMQTYHNQGIANLNISSQDIFVEQKNGSFQTKFVRTTNNNVRKDEQLFELEAKYDLKYIGAIFCGIFAFMGYKQFSVDFFSPFDDINSFATSKLLCRQLIGDIQKQLDSLENVTASTSASASSANLMTYTDLSGETRSFTITEGNNLDLSMLTDMDILDMAGFSFEDDCCKVIGGNTNETVIQAQYNGERVRLRMIPDSSIRSIVQCAERRMQAENRCLYVTPVIGLVPIITTNRDGSHAASVAIVSQPATDVGDVIPLSDYVRQLARSNRSDKKYQLTKLYYKMKNSLEIFHRSGLTLGSLDVDHLFVVKSGDDWNPSFMNCDGFHLEQQFATHEEFLDACQQEKLQLPILKMKLIDLLTQNKSLRFSTALPSVYCYQYQKTTSVFSRIQGLAKSITRRQ